MAKVKLRHDLRQRMDELLAEIEVANIDSTRKIWRRELHEEPPKLRSFLILRRMLAYKVQEAAFGGLPGIVRRKLVEIETRRATGDTKSPPPLVSLSPGVTLTREWNGESHEVRVTVEGCAYRGKIYKSLSVIARIITGTRWNGPKFFGLRDKA